MKLMSALLAVLMIYLSVMPCEDIKGADKCSTETHLYAQCNQHNDSHSDSDGCSPFCICQCCHTPVIMTSYFVRTSIVVNKTQDKLGYYRSLYDNSIINAIWHPPKSV